VDNEEGQMKKTISSVDLGNDYDCSHPTKKKSILAEADDLVSLDRQEQYGHPAKNFSDIAKIASAILGEEITAEECVIVMVAVKLGRLKFKYKHDSVVDLAGYLKVWDMIKETKEDL
jgi:hypothetical protein